MDVDERELARLRQIEQLKPRRGALLLLIPILSIATVLVVYVGSFLWLLRGRDADGERVTLTYTGCAEAIPVIERRVQTMGLGEPSLQPTAGGFTLTATLPSEPDVAAAIPQTLSRPGVLRSWREESPDTSVIDNSHVASAAMRQDLTLMPWTVLTLTDAGYERLLAAVRDRRDGRVVYTLDDQPIGTVSNLKGANREVELTPEGTDDRDRMHKAAARTVILDSGPLPCPVTLTPPR